MTFEELQAEAARQGYKLVKDNRRIIAPYLKCKDCIYLSEEQRSIGYRCVHPDKNFKNDTASFKSRSAKACKKFILKENQNG